MQKLAKEYKYLSRPVEELIRGHQCESAEPACSPSPDKIAGDDKSQSSQSEPYVTTCDVLIVGSGNLVHNLRAARFDMPASQAFDWAIEFDQWTASKIDSGDLAALQGFQKLGQLAVQAHPSFEHYLPVLYAAGAVHAGEKPRSFNTSFQGACISMRSVVWG